MSVKTKKIPSNKYFRIQIPKFSPYRIIRLFVKDRILKTAKEVIPYIVGRRQGKPEFFDPFGCHFFEEFIIDCQEYKLPISEDGSYKLSQSAETDVINFCNKYGLFYPKNRLTTVGAQAFSKNDWLEMIPLPTIRNQSDLLGYQFLCIACALPLCPGCPVTIYASYGLRFEGLIESLRIDHIICFDKINRKVLDFDNFRANNYALFAQPLMDFFRILRDVKNLLEELALLDWQIKLKNMVKPLDEKMLAKIVMQLDEIKKSEDLHRLEEIEKQVSSQKLRLVNVKIQGIHRFETDQIKLEYIQKLSDMLKLNVSRTQYSIVNCLSRFTDKEEMEIRFNIEGEEIKQKLVPKTLLGAFAVYLYEGLNNDNGFGECLNCGKIFRRSHGNQKFCPKDEHSKRSACENRYNQKNYRKNNKRKK